MYLLGFDIGSSSVKAALVESDSQKTISVVQYPKQEMAMTALQPGWAEQDPELWWEAVCKACQALLSETGISSDRISSIGVAYQMHGLVLVDEAQNVLRPSIIWCDSRAVDIGDKAFAELGQEYCLDHLLNSPGNFTASKLKWVRDNEPETFERIHKAMLPGDYIGMKMTGEILTTASGLSEGTIWDFADNGVAFGLLEHYGIGAHVVPEIVASFSDQGRLTSMAAVQMGLAAGTPVTYRAGDQPNNAISLGVFNPGQVAATGGTSGVVYGVVDSLARDTKSRVNSFAHVNHTAQDPRIGLLLCINGAGIQYAWMKQQVALDGTQYTDMERMAQEIPVGSDGLRVLPFGNGAERMLGNVSPGATVRNLHFNRHTRAHLYRAALEGIAFSFVHGFKVLRDLGLDPEIIRVGNDNLFRSAVFGNSVSSLLSCSIEVVETTGAVGSARASGIATGVYSTLEEALTQLSTEQFFHPEDNVEELNAAYDAWEKDLTALVN